MGREWQQVISVAPSGARINQCGPGVRFAATFSVEKRYVGPREKKWYIKTLLCEVFVYLAAQDLCLFPELKAQVESVHWSGREVVEERRPGGLLKAPCFRQNLGLKAKWRR